MKKLLTLALALMLLLSLSITAFAEDYKVGDTVIVVGNVWDEPTGSIGAGVYWDRAAENRDVLTCTEPDHTHGLSCYYLSCTDTEHSHGESCYDSTQLICTQHVHEDACWSEEFCTIWTLREMKPDTVKVVVKVADDSALSAEEIGEIKLRVNSTDLDGNNNSLTSMTFAAANGTSFEAQNRILSLSLWEDSLKRDGYKFSSSIDVVKLYTGHAGYENTVTITLDYWQEATVVFKKSFIGGSLLTETDAPETKLLLTQSGGSNHEATLNADNDWMEEYAGSFRAGTEWTLEQQQTVPAGYLLKSSLGETGKQSLTLKPGLNVIEVKDYFYTESSFTFGLDFTGELKADDFPTSVKLELMVLHGGEKFSAVLNANNNWQAELTLPTGDIMWTLDLPAEVKITEIYKLQSPAEGSFTNTTAGGSFTAPVNYIIPVGSFNINIHERAYIIKNGTLTETAKLSTGHEQSRYNVMISDGNATNSYAATTAQGLKFENIPQGRVYEVAVAGGNFISYIANPEITVGESEQTVDIYITYYYQLADIPIISGRKIDAVSGKALAGAEIACTYPQNITDGNSGVGGSIAMDTGNDGVFAFTAPVAGNYILQETEAPKGYYLNSTPVNVSVSEKWNLVVDSEQRLVITQSYAVTHDGEVDDGGVLVIKNTLLPTVDITVRKTFSRDDALTRPESVTAVLYKDGVGYKEVELSEANGWYYKFEDLPGGYYYSIDEKVVPEGYIRYIIRNGNDFTIINSGEVIPATGDSNTILLWALLAVLSVGSLAVLTFRRKKLD